MPISTTSGIFLDARFYYPLHFTASPLIESVSFSTQGLNHACKPKINYLTNK